MTRSLSFRARFLVTFLLGAVVPLAIAGVWLTRTMVSTGADLLRSELDASLEAVAGTVSERWASRQGDLLLLANNAVVREALARPNGAPWPGGDEDYLRELASQVQSFAPSFTYRDSQGAERWHFDRATGVERLSGDPSRRVTPAMTVVLPIVDAAGRALGQLEARVLLASVLPEDSLSIGLAGAHLTVLDRRTSVPLITLPKTAEPPAAVAATMVQVTRVLDSPPLSLVVAAPRAPYVAPFERAARIGLAVLMLVALGALGISWFFAARMSGALRQVADAADAVATGELDRSVTWRGRDEIGRLTAAFNSMTESLKRTLDALAERRALAAVGEFAASLSHEVRNGLTAIRVDLQHAERRLASGGSDRAKETELVGRALTNVRRLDVTVTGSLRASRGGMMERTTVELSEVLATAMRSAAPVFAATPASLDAPQIGEPVTVNGDAAALEQLFLNLLLNAGEAVPAGGRTQVSMTADDKRVTVSVIDNGVGMSDEALRRLGRERYSTKPMGSGLGVRIARRIAAAHGGEITFESRPGQGTTARVVLPRG